MRRLVKSHLLLGCWQVQRQRVVDRQAFFELYGRNPDVDDAVDSKAMGAPLSFSMGGDTLPVDTPPRWISVLNEFSAQLYAKPNETVHPSVVRKALEALEASASLPHDRRSRCCQQRWESALCVWNHADRSDHYSAALVAAVLYYSGKYDRVIHQVEKRWLTASIHPINLNDVSHVFRLMSIYVLAASFGGRRVSRPMIGKMKELTEKAWCMIREGKVTEVAREYKVFLWAADWYFSHTEDPSERNCISSTFTPLTSEKLRPYLFTTESLSMDAVKRRLPPAMLLRTGTECVTKGEKEKLLAVFTECKQSELSHDGFRLFQLSTRLGDMISLTPSINARALSEVVRFCGTALSFDSLKRIGSTQRCRSAVLQVLSCMEGPDAYFAARHVLFHQSAAAALAFQEAHGDTFCGDSQLVWQAALQSMKDSIAQGDIKWHESLPTVLRLLSDAGKTSTFFQLLKEGYSEGEGASLMTASALGQAARRSGQWWHSSDVLDMIVSCDPPRTHADDLFLEDACLQTLYALRDAKRWKEALAFYTSLAPVMPKAAHGVLCSVVCGMPVSAPWEEALAVAQSFGDVPEKFLTTLLCARDPARVNSSDPKTAHSWRYMLQGYAEGGHWRHALEYVQGRKEVELDAWISVLRSAQRSQFGDLSRDFFERLPQSVWGHKSLLRLTILIAEGHGYLNELHKALEKHTENTIVAEYDALVCFLMRGCAPPAMMTFTDEYVIHRLLMSPAPAAELIYITVTWTNNTREMFYRRYKGNMKAFVEGHYKVHASCIPKKSRRILQGTFMLNVIPPHGTLSRNDTLVSVLKDVGVVVAYKPTGADTHSYARLVAQRIQLGLMHYSAYLLNPSSCGLILLLSSTISTKAVHLRITLLARVIPMNSVSLPLLSTKFYAAYAMSVLFGPFSDGGVVIKATCHSDPDGLLAGSFYRLKESLASEGWGISLQENGTCRSGDKDEFVCLTELVLSIRHAGFDAEPMYFSTSIPPSCMSQLSPEEAHLFDTLH
ncbi:hypothetical protein TraAM80_05380 [Trypanosoma rangeli]|uniref:Uncharacterized protein n=1 Tax=Trypanosoma rangeli TaxID=5698 RepID=A0A422NEU9_TRYRA|nr:uncharacterized protein TraAM80_05380 [Trypanosoma rangeli]RNF03994.1 hypothetical protein TraAM80_05380 [Trypanosoma rangeli]|eukprot:RNF03994.1 hypothetical protein TraAM80_05380 [Trypanosoma rangeli]